MSKIKSRKLLVFALGTVGLIAGFISEQTWLILSGVYIGSQAIVDASKYFGKSSIGGELPPDDDE